MAASSGRCVRRRASRQGRPQIRPRSRLTGGLDTSEPVLSAILALAQWREPEENDPKTWRSNMRSWSEAGLHGGEESMSDDPDLPKASYVLQVLGQARLSRNETAAKMVEHLMYVAANTGLRPPRNRASSASRLDRNFRAGECFGRRRFCRAHYLESSAQSYPELERTADVDS
jgi:hypothetical protein